ncbi:MAG: hypothetical protein IJ786_05170 [Bacteroidaceae bacterium]|nr:hypothetical protein [Bacteroidaceae bacterium]
MKHSIYNIYTRVCVACAFLFTIGLPAVAQTTDTGDVDDAESAAMARTKKGAPTLQETDPTGANYMGERRALVGRHCAVNRLVNVVDVGTGTSGLENLTNEDIDDYATFPQVISATVAVSPIVSVRDMKNYYAPGTTAGFCIVAGSGSSVLSLDLIKTYHIWFYCDGKRVADKTVREANSGSGVTLSLIGIPGSQQACANLTAICDQKFDEVALVQGGAVDASVGSVVMIKYAFVGAAHDIYLTKKSVSEYVNAPDYTDNTNWAVTCEGFMPSPLVGGIPIPMADFSEDKVIGTDTNERLSETMALVSAIQLASVVFKGRVRVNVKNKNAESELFHAGDQVGFKYNFVKIADVLELGTWVDIKLYDRNGNDVQTTTISADVLKLSIASGGDQTSYIVAEKDFSGAEITFYSTVGVLNLGSGYGVYYAFVRPRPTVDHECLLNPSMNTNLCAQQTSLQLKSNPEITVSWRIIEQPKGAAATVDEEGFVQNMTVPGTYAIECSSDDGLCSEIVYINQGAEADFNAMTKETVLVGDDYELTSDLHNQTSANLLSISDITDSENILDGDLTNYATYNKGLQLAGANGIIVGLKQKEGYLYDGSKANSLDAVRIGFVVEMQQTGIGLSLLNAFQIRCFDEEGNRIYSDIVENAGVVGLNLIGSNANDEDRVKSNKIRFCITIPKTDRDGNVLRVKEIQLWKIGTLDLEVSDIRFYYPFMDDPADPDNNQVRDGADIVTYDNFGAIVNVGTQVNVAAVGCVTNNLSNIIDIDPKLETYALMQKTVESGSQRIVVKLGRTVDFRHQVGVVVNNDIIGLNANVGSVFRIESYKDGQKTGESATNWNVLGANVIAGSNQTVLLMQPKSDFDEIHIVAGEGLAANRTIKIYGILLRNDIDNDGIPDNRDTETCSDEMIMNVVTPHVCEGNTLSFSCVANNDHRYYLSFPDQGINMLQKQSEQDGSITLDIETIKAGQFTFYIYDGDQKLIYTDNYEVHPKQTTWRVTTTSTDWNNWNNWTNGTPYLCTNVIMPSGARVYPSLDREVINGDEFGCAGIHFEHGAAVEKVFKLNYNQAWVDFTPETGRYYMLAVPLKDVYTGDFFVTSAANDILTSDNYFMPLNSETYPENRFAPQVYQRLYGQTATHRLTTKTLTAILLGTNWSERFNLLNTSHALGNVFSLYVDRDNREGDLTIRLPKEYDTYYYFYEADRSRSSISESLTRTNPYRFVYEADGLRTIEDKDFGIYGVRSVYGGASTLSQTLSNPTLTTTFMASNPFMSYINVKEFLKANPQVTGIKVFNGEATSSIISIDGSLLSNVDEATYEISPMQAFYVTTATERTTLEIRFTEAMFTMTERAEEPEPTRAMFRIKAATSNYEASAVLVDQAELGQVETLVDEDAVPQVAVFTMTADGRACDIQSLNDSREIELGIFVKEGIDSVKLSIESFGGLRTEDYRLLDRNTGLTYILENIPAFALSGTTIGRFVLVNVASEELTGISTLQTATDDLQISIDGQTATIVANDGTLLTARAYNAEGRLLDSYQARGTNAVLRLQPGVVLLQIKREGLGERTYRVLVP